MRQIMKRAWAIRREAAARFGCRASEISMSECLRMAWAENKGKRMVEYKSATGRAVKAWIETDRENEADHNITSPCYKFRLEVEGLGRIAVSKLEGGHFVEYGTRRIGNKAIRVHIPASQEAASLYADYLAEIDRRIARGRKLEQEYVEHYNNVARAMAE